MRTFLITVALLCMGLTMACSGGGSTPPPTPTGHLTIRFGSDSVPGVKEVWLSMEKIEGSTDGNSWISLGDVKATFNLMTLQNGQSALILPAISVPTATYSHFRITWATVNYAGAGHQPAYLLDADKVERLISPSPTTTVVNGSITVPTNGSAFAQIMLTGQQLVQARPGGTYSFQAVGRALDLSTSATITGLATANGAPLPQVEVFAEYLDGNLNPVIQRRAYTNLDGKFILEGLPAGLSYFVVSQPTIYPPFGPPTAAFPAMAVVPKPGTVANTFVADLLFTASQTPGSLLLAVTPVSTPSQATWGELIQSFFLNPQGQGSNLIVRSETTASSTFQDQVTFLGVFPGSYGVVAQRSTLGAAPARKTPGNSVSVPTGPSVPVNLSYL